MTPEEISATTTSCVLASGERIPTVYPVPYPITKARWGESLRIAGTRARSPIVSSSPGSFPSDLPLLTTAMPLSGLSG